MRNKEFLLALLLMLGVGFAAVSATLLMTGNVTIATNNANFDVIFTKAELDGTDISSTAIIESGKKITFGTKDLVSVGDVSKLDFEVTNNSEMYDAEVSINCSATGTNNSYYQIIPSGTMTIAGKTIGTGNVQVKLLKASAENITEEFTCTLTATAKERDTKARVRYVPKYFAFGTPTTASTQDYTTLGKNIFGGLDATGSQKSVCIIRNGSLECFKHGNYAEEQEHIKEVFSDIICSSDSYFINCNASDFGCGVSSDGNVSCYDYVARQRCSFGSDGSVTCS